MNSAGSPLRPRAKPLKRPKQARARFTVQAIYDAYVRIWQRDGWDRLTTRNVALETGIAVGTLYDYFPSKEALHSGYVRHCIEGLIRAVEQQAVEPDNMAWETRVRRVVSILAGIERDDLSWFHPDMLQLEPYIADQKHQRRAYEELLAMWHRVFAACPEIADRIPPATIEALHLSVWGGRRYAMLVRLDEPGMVQWAVQTERLCCATVAAAVRHHGADV